MKVILVFKFTRIIFELGTEPAVFTLILSLDVLSKFFYTNLELLWAIQTDGLVATILKWFCQFLHLRERMRLFELSYVFFILDLDNINKI